MMVLLMIFKKQPTHKRSRIVRFVLIIVDYNTLFFSLHFYDGFRNDCTLRYFQRIYYYSSIYQWTFVRLIIYFLGLWKNTLDINIFLIIFYCARIGLIC